MDAKKKIRLLEHEIEKVKILHVLKLVSTKEAKDIILKLDSKIIKNLNTLPEHDRHLYMIKREHGHFY